jgi:hypothetical protein
MPEPVGKSALVVPLGASWNDVLETLPLIEACKVVYTSEDAAGFYVNAQKTEMVLKLPPPRMKGTATCNADGTITFDFTIE